MPLADDIDAVQVDENAATESSLRVSRSSESSQCFPASVSPDFAVNSRFDCYKEHPDASDGGTSECLETSGPVSYQASGEHAACRWTRSDFMRLRTVDWCTTLPQDLQYRPEIRALLKPPGLALPEQSTIVPPTTAAIEVRNPRTVDVRFVRDEIVSATEANACAWRKKATTTRFPEPAIARVPPAASSVGSASRDWRSRRSIHDSREGSQPTSGGLGDEWLMPTGIEDYDLGTVKNDVEMFEEMRKQARQEWAGTSPAESETEDVLHKLMAESMNETSSHAENGSHAVHALQISQQIDVQSLFMDSGTRVQSAGGDAGSDRPEPHSGQERTTAFSRSSSGIIAPAGTATGHVDMMQHGYQFPGRDRDPLVHASAAHVHARQDSVDVTATAAPLNGGSASDSMHQQNAGSAELGGDGSSIWGGGGMGAGRLAQDAPVSEVDWKMMREIWNRPSSSSEGVQQQMQGMQLADSCIGSGQQTGPPVNGNMFGPVQPQPQQHTSSHNVNVAVGSTGLEPGGEANAMKVLMQLWSSNSEPSAALQAPPQGKTTADMLNAQQQDLSQQLMAFHQQHQQKQQAQKQAAANSTAVSAEQMLEHFYQQRAVPAARHATNEPTASDLYTQAMARAGHGGSQHMANHAYARQSAKPVQQNGMQNGQYTSQAQQLATVLWFQASMAQASQAAQTQRQQGHHQQGHHQQGHHQQGHNASVRRTQTQDMYRGGTAPVNSHAAAALLQQLQQGSGSSQMSSDQYSAAAAAAVAAAQQQNMSQTLRNQMYGAAEQKQHMYAPVSNAHMMRPSQALGQQSSAQVPNYAESVVRAMLLPTAARQHQAQHFSQYRQQQPQPQPRYNNAAAGLHMPQQHTATQNTVAQSGFAHAPGSGVAPNNFSRFYDAGRMQR